jgi:hypothetical protein
MASNVTRDHHSLNRNLKLNGNYISNDGGDEGISIADTGQITLGGSGSYIPISAGILNTGGGINLECSNMITLDSSTTGAIYMTKDSLLVSGNLFCEFHMGNKYQKWTYDVSNHCTLTIGSAGDTELATLGSGATDSHLTLDIDGDIILDSATGITKFYLAGSTTDYASLTVAANGVTTLTTVDNGVGAVGHLTLDADGYINLDAHDAGVGGGIRFLEAGTIFGTINAHHTGSYFTLYENEGASTDDYFHIFCAASGAATIATQDAAGSDAHLNIEADGHVEFDNCAVGFDKLSGTFGTSAVIGSPNDGTDIDFRLGNKYELILTDDMGSDDLLNLIFPAVSGNFILVLVHDPSGGYQIHDGAWKAYASDGSLADSTLAENGTDGEVRWAGGATPTLSANGKDIDVISIYWDADTQTALAVASLDFAAV